MKRREFVTASAFLPLLKSTAASANSKRAKVTECDVAVIGAGLAGLNAALRLQSQGKDVLVIEARDRSGGRLETTEVDGLRFELGAVEVGDNYVRFLALAKQLGVPLIKPKSVRIPGITISMDGQLLNEVDWAKSALNPQTDAKLRAFAPSTWLMDALAGPNPLSSAAQWQDARMQMFDLPLRDYLQQLGHTDPQMLRMMEVASNYNDFKETSALDILRRDALRRAAGPNAGTLAVEGGSQALPDAMAKALKRKIVKAETTQVRQIGRLSKRFELSNFIAFDSSPVLHAKSVIVAIPAPCMRLFQFDHPKLDRTAINPLFDRPMTKVTTLHFRPTQKFWEADGLSPNMWIDGPLERTFAAANAAGEIERIIVWINGRAAEALDKLGADLPRFVEMELARLRPSTKGALQLLATRSWGQDSLAGGAYVEIAAGQCQKTALAIAALNTLPTGLAFAGEHTVFDYSGMEAALVSGERAAERVA